MKESRPPLVLYFIACAIYMLSVILKDENLMLLSKPVIAPSILFYYWQEMKGRISFAYLATIVLFFIGDMVILIGMKESFIYIILLFLIAYVIYLKNISENLIKYKLRIKQKTHFLVLLMCIFFLFYLFVASMDLLIESGMKNLGLLIVYGLILLLIGFVSSFSYILKPSRLNFFMCITSLCFIISDVFYTLKTYYYELEIFDWFNNLTQVLSYYYVTKYFIIKQLSARHEE